MTSPRCHLDWMAAGGGCSPGPRSDSWANSCCLTEQLRNVSQQRCSHAASCFSAVTLFGPTLHPPQHGPLLRPHGQLSLQILRASIIFGEAARKEAWKTKRTGGGFSYSYALWLRSVRPVKTSHSKGNLHRSRFSCNKFRFISSFAGSTISTSGSEVQFQVQVRIKNGSVSSNSSAS